MDLIIKDFSPYDAPKDTIYEMKEMKIGNASIEEHVAKFKMLVTNSVRPRPWQFTTEFENDNI